MKPDEVYESSNITYEIRLNLLTILDYSLFDCVILISPGGDIELKTKPNPIFLAMFEN